MGILQGLVLLMCACCGHATNIKWTPGGGEKPLPYSKRYRDSLNIKEEDLPSWHFPDGHPRSGSSGSAASAVVGVVVLLGMAAILWSIYRKHRQRNAAAAGAAAYAMPGAPAGPVMHDVKASEAEVKEAREARLKRFEEAAAAEAERRQKETYADVMAAAMGKPVGSVRQRARQAAT